MGYKIAGLDLEGMNEDITKGINLNVDRITEFGIVLYDWDLKTPIEMYSRLSNEEGRLEITQENTDITGITEDMLNNYGEKDIVKTLSEVAAIMEKAHFIMAHNGGNAINPDVGYDYKMLSATFERYGMSMPKTPWIDSLTDVVFPKEILSHTRGGRSMMVLEHAHGFINPFPHRAVTDVLSMLKIMSNYDLETMIKNSKSPYVEVVANFSYPNTRYMRPEEAAKAMDAFNETKTKVSKARFRWNPDDKIWAQTMREPFLIEASANWDFEWSGRVVAAEEASIVGAPWVNPLETQESTVPDDDIPF